MGARACVSALIELLVNMFYGFHFPFKPVDIVYGCGLSNIVCYECLPKKPKRLAIFHRKSSICICKSNKISCKGGFGLCVLRLGNNYCNLIY